MRCPNCAHEYTELLPHKPGVPTLDGDALVRARVCVICEHTWLTVETDLDHAHAVGLGRLRLVDGREV